MHRSAAGKLRRPGRALAGTTGALLAIGLAAAASYFTPGFGVGRALTSGGQLRDDDLVHERDVDLNVEQLVGQVDGAIQRA